MQSRNRPEHNPIGNPCVLCRHPPELHRVDHIFKGRVKCTICGLPVKNHRMRTRADPRPRVDRKRAPEKPREALYLGVDGEGQGRKHHRYVLLAAANESGTKTYKVESEELTTEDCLWFLYNLPKRARLFCYSFGYDLTKMLQDLDDRALYLLFRPELRQRFGAEAKKGPWSVLWKGWTLNLQGTKFTFGRTGPSGRKRIVWDIWKFYQSKFTTALDDWKVGTEEERTLIRSMKEQRAEFDKLDKAEVEKYCFLECQKMAELARKLIEAHERAGLPLKSFYGAGSTASVMLEDMGIRRFIEKPPPEMRDAIACAFSGGRFDDSIIGVCDNTHSWDISSAYPYQCCHLPCLAHGHWEHTNSRDEFDRARWALVRYGLSAGNPEEPWGPFPFRFPKGHKEAGSICYPIQSGGGWVYQDEYREGERLFDNVYFREAWIFKSECDCMPFQKLPLHYIERCRIGKEGPGIVLKLGCNSCYGKLAQSVGNGRYNSWIWAGMITSGTRAQILHALGLHRDRSNMLMVATDGILTREELVLPEPMETGTNVEFLNDKGKPVRKPLGGWEYKSYDRGVFIARPGVYFPMHPTEIDMRILRGRGVGRRVILENWERIVGTWENWNRKGQWPMVKLDNVSRFCGAKTSISRKKLPGHGWEYKRAAGQHLRGQPRFGEWITRPVEMSYNPRPKREGVRADGTLPVRMLPLDLESAPYSKAILSAEAKELMILAAQMGEQPDIDSTEYDFIEDGSV